MMAYLTDPATLILVLASLGSFVSILAVGLPLVRRDQLDSRLKAVAERRVELSRHQQASLRKSAQARTLARVGFMKQVLERLKLQQLIQSKAVRRRLAQAGWRSQAAAITFTFTRLVLPIGLGLFTALMLFGSQKFVMPMPVKFVVLAVVAVIGFYLPNVLVSNRIQHRQQAIRKAFPDALDLLVICVESGSSIEGAFARVTDELADSSPELAEELGLTTAELSYLGDRRQAFQNLTERVRLASVRSLATALIQSEKYGTPVAVALRVLAQENRDERMIRAEKKAGALPAQLTVPMIVFFLPTIFVIILGPAVIQTIASLGP